MDNLVKLTQAQLDEIIIRHNLYQENKPGGEKADLSYKDLSGLSLASADLIDANFYAASLTDADLSRANLTGANMREANLTGANMREANLTGANMREANLIGANMREVNLIHAELRDTNLRWTQLNNADLTRADLSHANVSNADLSNVNITGTDLYVACADHVKGIDIKVLSLGSYRMVFIAGEIIIGFERKPIEWWLSGEGDEFGRASQISSDVMENMKTIIKAMQQIYHKKEQ